MTDRILVVDDEESMRDSLYRMLSAEGYLVSLAENGRSALAQLERNRFDYILCDIRMPEMGGLELLREEVEKAFGPVKLLYASRSMEDVVRMVEKVKDYDTTVLVTGEIGTGKELVAQMLHFAGRRKERPFVAINCGAIPETLLESELFGHRKGAFTEAKADRAGLIEKADGGTLFLDEIGDMPLMLQTKLLRFLQEGELRRLGDTEVRKVNVRIVAATARDLGQEVSAGSFREDLYYRLNVIRIHVPPLRERREDIPLLAQHSLARFRAKFRKGERSGSPRMQWRP